MSQLHLQETYLRAIAAGTKTVEGRLLKPGKYDTWQVGDRVEMICGDERLWVVIDGLRQYPSVVEMLEAEGLEAMLPGVATLEEGAAIYHAFWTVEEVAQCGMLAIGIRVVA